jgi:hypothetical protein
MPHKLHPPPLFPAQQAVPKMRLITMLGHDARAGYPKRYSGLTTPAAYRVSVIVFRGILFIYGNCVSTQRDVRSASPALPPEGSNEAQGRRSGVPPFSASVFEIAETVRARLSALRAADQRNFANHGWNLDAKAIPNLPARARP